MLKYFRIGKNLIQAFQILDIIHNQYDLFPFKKMKTLNKVTQQTGQIGLHIHVTFAFWHPFRLPQPFFEHDLCKSHRTGIFRKMDKWHIFIPIL